MKKLLALVLLFIVVVPTVQAYANSGLLDGRIIILDAGHGAGNSPQAPGGYLEHERMLYLANRIRPLLEAHGATVHFTRPTSTMVHQGTRAARINMWALEVLLHYRERELAYTSDTTRLQSEIFEIERYITLMRSVANNPDSLAPIYFNIPFDESRTRVAHPTLRRMMELQADPIISTRFLVISLHSNAASSTGVSGADAFYMSNNDPRSVVYFNNYTNVELSRYFATTLLRGISNAGIRNRGARSANWLITREHNLPAVLVENGYHTNPQDRALLQSSDFMQRLAQEYVNAIITYFNFVGPIVDISLPEIEAESAYSVLTLTKQVLSDTETFANLPETAVFRMQRLLRVVIFRGLRPPNPLQGDTCGGQTPAAGTHLR